jgi:hypothetical protein
MWTYSVTTATTSPVSRASTTAAGITQATEFGGATVVGGGAVAYGVSTTSATGSTVVADPFATSSSASTSYSSTVTQTEGALSLTGSYSSSSSEFRSSGSTRTLWSTRQEVLGGATTGTTEFTTPPLTRDSYNSSTTTSTANSAYQTTITLATTESRVTTAAGPTTTATTAAVTQTTVTATVAPVTITTYTTKPSTTLAAPESLVPVSEAAASEYAWEVTAAGDSAGFASHLGSTFTKRTGTLVSSSTALPVSSSASFTSTFEQTTSVSGGSTNSTITLTTTITASTADTYIPFASVFPATATATRSLNLLTTTSTTFARPFTRTITQTLLCPPALYNNAPVTFLDFTTATAPVTHNVGPTLVSTASLHLTFSKSRTMALVRPSPPYATSESGNAAGGATATTTQSTSASSTRSTTTGTTTSGTVAATSTNHLYHGTTQDAGTTSTSSSESTATSSSTLNRIGSPDGFTGPPVYWDFATESTYYTWGPSFSSTAVTSIVSDDTMTVSLFTSSSLSEAWSTSYSYDRFSDGGAGVFFFSSSSTSSSSSTYSESGTTTHSETFITDLNTYSTSVSTSATTTSSTSTNTTTSLTTGATTGTISGSSYSATQGISWTFPALASQVTRTGSAAWSAQAMHPRQGFRHPISLSTSDALYSALSVSPASSIYYPRAATQDDVAGAAAPILATEVQAFNNGSSVYSGRWDTSDSRLHYSSGVSSSYTTTEGTLTFTRTVTTASTEWTVSFSGASAVSWYIPSVTAAASDGSHIGGIPAKSSYGAELLEPPGVLHSTRQTNGTTSSSDTTWSGGATAFTSTNLGHALPTRTESAWSVTNQETSWSHDTVLGHGVSTGATSKPVITLSKYPDL